MKKRDKIIFFSFIIISLIYSIGIISGVNVALNKPTSAFYAADGKNNSVDGDLYTHWNAGANPGGGNNANLSIDLQAGYVVKNYSIHCAGSFGGNNGTIYFYHGTNFITKREYSSCNYDNIYPGVGGIFTDPINVTNIIINAIQHDDSPNIAEFELFQCTPDCSNGKCGTANNGCLGTCANIDCGTGKTCNVNTCTDNTPPPCTSNWNCTTWSMCNISNKQTRVCSDLNSCANPNNRTETQDCICNATLNCQGKTCGSNGCGGICGSCLNGQSCDNGNCVGNCTNHSDCGVSGFFGDNFCQSGNVKKNFINFTCINPGLSNASCSNATFALINISCASNQLCNGTNGSATCINVTCSRDSDCFSNNPCVNDFCNTTSNTCYRQNNNTNTCNDYNGFTFNDHCSNGYCVGETICNSNMNCESNRGETCGNCPIDCGSCSSFSAVTPAASSTSSQVSASTNTGETSNATASADDEEENDGFMGKLFWFGFVFILVIVIAVVLFFIFSSFSNRPKISDMQYQ